MTRATSCEAEYEGEKLIRPFVFNRIDRIQKFAFAPQQLFASTVVLALAASPRSPQSPPAFHQIDLAVRPRFQAH